jgi:tetratricopeptide (TPR) repeat protein
MRSATRAAAAAASMGWLDRLLGRKRGMEVRDGVCLFRVREFGDYLKPPAAANFTDDGPQICGGCNRAMAELLLTTGGPGCEPDVWRDVPIAVDGWACVECGTFRVPRKMTPAQINGFVDEGARAGKAGQFAEAEWWFTRVTWDWPGYLLGHLNLGEALSSRLRQSPDLEPPVRRVLKTRMRDQYEAAVDSYQRSPDPTLLQIIVRAQLILAELAIEDRAFDRARRSLRAVAEQTGVDEALTTRANELQQYLDERGDLFDAAVVVLDPYLDYMNRQPKPIETPEERTRVVQALEDLQRHYQLAPTRWQTAWQIAKGRAALDGIEAAIESWRRAWTTHPGQRDIARELSLALLRTDRVKEALEVNRAIVEAIPGDATLWCNLAVCELLNGNLTDARRCVEKCRVIDPADPIAGAVEKQVARCEAGAALPRTLRELERG